MEEEVITTSFVKRLVKEIEELKEINEQHRKINAELRDKINKAREYIEKNTDNTNFLEVPSKELLKILDKGE